MAIAASGAVSLADFRTEFVGGSSAISLGDLYRGGSNIRAKAGNNTATNLAASVPTSGAIDFADFYSTAKGFRKTYTSGATNQDASSVFGDDYGVDYPKEIVINSGVELGATSTSQEALQIDSGLSGGLTITNNGTLSGAGGSANGGAGGDAFQADVACTLINNGTIRGGGGGGGQGGTGGQGRTSSTGWGNTTSWFGSHTSSPYRYVYLHTDYYKFEFYWDGAQVGSSYTLTANIWYYFGSYRYQRDSGYAGSWPVYYYRIRRENQVTNYTYHNGGSGGAGGRGQGYNQTSQSGSSGSSGGSNAGNGGTGGSGASFGSSGSSGNSGANGNYTNGSGGSGGGANGKGIRGYSNISDNYTNNGTVQGGTA